MSDSCKCQCKCILVSEECIYDLSALTAESKIVLKKPWIFDRIHDFHLRSILGDCLDEICTAKAAAIAAAEAANDGSTYRDHIAADWLLILDNHFFRSMYALYAEFYGLRNGSTTVAGDGLIEYERAQENNTGISRNVSERKAASFNSQSLADAQSYQTRFENYLKTIADRFSCLPSSCTPCGEAKQSGISSIRGFAKYEPDYANGKKNCSYGCNCGGCY